MLLELDNSKLLHLLEMPEALAAKVAEAIQCLRANPDAVKALNPELLHLPALCGTTCVQYGFQSYVACHRPFAADPGSLCIPWHEVSCPAYTLLSMPMLNTQHACMHAVC